MIKSRSNRYAMQESLINDQENILKELARFYESLYSNNKQVNEDDCYNFIHKLPLPTITKRAM